MRYNNRFDIKILFILIGAYFFSAPIHASIEKKPEDIFQNREESKKNFTQYQNLDLTNNILSFPLEILEEICSYCSFYKLAQLQSVGKKFRKVCKKKFEKSLEKYPICFNFKKKGTEKRLEKFLKFCQKKNLFDTDMLIEIKNLAEILRGGEEFHTIKRLKVSGKSCHINKENLSDIEGYGIFSTVFYLPYLPVLEYLDLKHIQLGKHLTLYQEPVNVQDENWVRQSFFSIICNTASLILPFDIDICQDLFVELEIKSENNTTIVKFLDMSGINTNPYYFTMLAKLFPELTELNLSNSKNIKKYIDSSCTKKGLKELSIHPFQHLVILDIADTKNSNRLFEIDELSSFIDAHPTLQEVKLSEKWLKSYASHTINNLKFHYPNINFLSSSA